jgi:hypothetical protein
MFRTVFHAVTAALMLAALSRCTSVHDAMFSPAALSQGFVCAGPAMVQAGEGNNGTASPAPGNGRTEAWAAVVDDKMADASASASSKRLCSSP